MVMVTVIIMETVTTTEAKTAAILTVTNGNGKDNVN